jgi:hypothetical protein
MTTAARAPVDALDRVLLRTYNLLIDFDGPVCSLFAGTPTAAIVDAAADDHLARRRCPGTWSCSGSAAGSQSTWL